MVGLEINYMDPKMRTTNNSPSNSQEIKKNTDEFIYNFKLKSKELQALIKYRGVNNIRFYANIITLNNEIPIESIENIIGERETVECQIDESLYKVSDWYKITLVPVKESGKFGYEHYYVTNLVSLINEGLIRIKN